MRIALGITYNGSAYHGWQRQIGLSSIQQKIEDAVSRVANHRVQLQCAGRTDTGVHATGQVAHFDTYVEREPHAWILGTNTYLPNAISIEWAQEMPGEFHARHKAIQRRYTYIICNTRIRSGLLPQQFTWVHPLLDENKMAEGAKFLIGEHDFTSFRAVGCQAKTPIRTLTKLTVMRENTFIILSLEANAFLHHMVRNIAGSLIAVGHGKYPPEWIAEVLDARNRRKGSVTAPPYGLYFTGVSYEPPFTLPPEKSLQLITVG